MRRYVLTDRGKNHWSFLNNPDAMTKEERRASFKQKEDMTVRDWAKNQITLLCLATDYCSVRDLIYDAKIILEDSEVRQYMLKHIDELVDEMVAAGMLKSQYARLTN